MDNIGACLSEVIGGIGAPDFAATAATSLARHSGFDLAAAVLHSKIGRPRVLFHNFGTAGCGAGLETYVRHTYRANPMLRRNGAVRARDFAGRPAAAIAALHPHLESAPEEELGYRTCGWPKRQEEIGLYLEGSAGVVELSFYRPRGRNPAPDALLASLDSVAQPVGAAFERHFALGSGNLDYQLLLSPRECQVCELLAAGCSTDAIAMRLGISRYTVKDHRKHIFRKLGVGSLAQLFAKLNRPPPRRDGTRLPERRQALAFT